jgi:hypothetical protein
MPIANPKVLRAALLAITIDQFLILNYQLVGLLLKILDARRQGTALSAHRTCLTRHELQRIRRIIAAKGPAMGAIIGDENETVLKHGTALEVGTGSDRPQRA